MPYTTQTSDFWGWYLRHNNRVVWSHLYDAGIDTFASGPSNNPQSFLDLTNVLPAMSGGFNRRWGTQQLSQSTFPSISLPTRTFVYSSPQDNGNVSQTANTNVWLTTDNQNFNTYTDSGILSSAANIPMNFSNVGNVGAVTSRSWFYYGNGIEPPRKVNPSYTTTSSTDSLLGIRYPGYGSNSTKLLDYPCAILSQNENYIFLPGPSSTLYPASTGYGYTSVPAVSVADPTGSGSGASISVTLGVHGEVIGWSLDSGGSNYVEAIATVAAPTAVGATQAYLTLYVQRNSAAPFYGQVVGADLGGPMQFVAGRKYAVALQNSVTGHTSDVYTTNLPPSQITGTFLDDLTSGYSQGAGALSTNIPVYATSNLVDTGFTQVELVISVPQSGLDPQVDTVILLATSDGGSVGTLYQVVILPLSKFTLVNGYYQYYYVDTLPDSYSDNIPNLTSSTGTVSANQYLTNLTFNGSQYQFNSSNGGQIRTAGIPPGTLTDYIVATDSGINVPLGATITGVTASITWAGQASGTGILQSVALYHSGVQIGTVKNPVYTVTAVNPATESGTFGNPTDIWGTVLTPAIVNDPSFGFGIQVETQLASTGLISHTDRSFFYSWTITVYYSITGASQTSGDTLLNEDLWTYTDSFGDTFGILLNEPPTSSGFQYPVSHQGRLFSTDGKTVFFSKSLDEVTTATGLITSKWEECWPGDYQLPIALNNEFITGIKSDGTNLHVGTNKSIFTVYGSDPSNFDVPSVAFAQTGVLSNDCWSVIYAEGVPSGFIWITPDYKVLHSDFSTYREIGTPIYPKLVNLDKTKIQFNKVLALSQGPYNFAVLQLFTTASATQPEYYVWETRLQKWYRWAYSPAEINGSTTIGASAFVYEYPGYTTSSFTPGSRYLFYWMNDASAGKAIRYFNPASLQDLGTIPIAWNVQTSWQTLGDPTAIKTLNEVEVTGDDGPFAVSIYGATSQAQFDLGGTLLKTGSTVTGPIASLGAQKLYCAGSNTTAKYYSFQIAPISPGTNPAVLTNFSTEFYPMARI